MKTANFEIHKLKREIQTSGEYFVLYKSINDAYGEPTGDIEHKETFRGIFHISKGFSSGFVGDGGTTHNVGQPMLLCLYSDMFDKKRDSFIEYNDKTYKIVDINNIGEYNIVCDLSLELVINGKLEY